MPGNCYQWQTGALILNVRVQPGAQRDSLAGILGDRLKIRLQAPPVDGKANQALIKFIARTCGVAPRQVSLLSGHNSRDKRLRIEQPRCLPDGVRLA